MAADRVALGEFLRARRDRITPAEAGIQAFPGPRRVPGLRREELAVLAGLSADYYSRVEQGRQAVVSGDVLDALSRALRLTSVECAHLRRLADPPDRPRRPVHAATQRADPGLSRVMAALDHLPVLLLGHRGEVLARNALLPAVLGHPMPPGASFVRWLWLDPGARERIINWPDFARATIGALRLEAGQRPWDEALLGLVDEIRRADPDAARWWDDHTVRAYTSVAKRILHPVAGELRFDIEIVGAPSQPDQRLVVYAVEPDSETARMLPLLASWDATVTP